MGDEITLRGVGSGIKGECRATLNDEKWSQGLNA
jgi:hypothetical protein